MNVKGCKIDEPIICSVEGCKRLACQVCWSGENYCQGHKLMMVVYAYTVKADGLNSAPWIYGVFEEHEGFKIMEERQSDPRYSHLMWSNNIIQLNTEPKGVDDIDN